MRIATCVFPALAAAALGAGAIGAAPQAGAPAASAAADPSGRAAEVREAERAFAATMAGRDLAAFGTFVAEEAVFLGGGVLRGKTAVVEGWKRFYEGKEAPFSWEPQEVEVLDSGALALSSGPVFDPQGERVGTFNSIWRREPDGRWRVVFDKGCPPCPACP